MKETLILSDDTYISAGARRECHFHPQNENLCIKIPMNKNGVKDCSREISYLNKVKKRINFEKYSKFIGKVDTNKGVGYVYELIKDVPTGNVSRPLKQVYLSSLFLNQGPKIEALERKMSALIEELKQNKMLVTDLKPDNIVVQYTDESNFELKIIDGMGRTNFVPFLDRFGLISERKIKDYCRRNLTMATLNYKEAFDFLSKNSNGS